MKRETDNTDTLEVNIAKKAKYTVLNRDVLLQLADKYKVYISSLTPKSILNNVITILINIINKSRKTYEILA